MKKFNVSWLFFISVFVLILFTVFSYNFNTVDELWNFQNIYKMYQGGLIYNCNNVIDTPIFFLIGNLLFKFLGGNFITFKIYTTIIYFLKFLIIYIIFRKFNFSKQFSSFYTAIFISNNYIFLFCGISYNTLALVFSYLGIILYLSLYESKKYHLLQGFLIFIVFFTKQTIGIYYAFGIILFDLLELGFSKSFFKNQILKFITFLPCLIFSIFCMFWGGNLNNFIDLCFGGILEFKNKNMIFQFESLSVIIPIIIIFFTSITLLHLNKLDKNIKKNIRFLLCLAFGMTFNIFPIVNVFHTNMAFSIYLILFIYIIHTILISQIFDTNLKWQILTFICIIFMFIRTLFEIDLTAIWFDKTSPFYGSRISQENFDRITIITNYISEKQNQGIKVVILSAEAGAYNIPLNINNRGLDLPLSGNFGFNGIEKTISKISNMKNTEFLIFTNEEDCFYQESMEIREYILKNFKKNGELLNYSIYINE